MSIDAPDWVKIVKSVPFTGADVDAPDWVRQVAGEGGVPIGGSLTFDHQTLATNVTIPGNSSATIFTTGSLAVGTWLFTGQLEVQWNNTQTLGLGAQLVGVTGAFTPGNFNVGSWSQDANSGGSGQQDWLLSFSIVGVVSTAGTFKLSVGEAIGSSVEVLHSLNGTNMTSLQLAT